MDYLDNNRLIAHYCGFNIMKPLPSYWTYDRCLRQLNNGALKSIMANLVRKLYELGVVDASFVGLDSTSVMANTKQNNPKSFAKNKFSKENHPKSDPDCALGVHSASNQHNERRYEFYWGYKSHVLVDCISGLPLYELTTPGNVADPAVAAEILAAADQTISLKECAFLADKGYDVKSIYNTVKTVYEGEAFIPLNPRGTKDLKALSAGNPVCEAGLAMHKDGKTTDNHCTRQKFCCPCRKVCFRAADFQGDCFRLGPTRCHKPAVRQQRCKARKSRTLSDQGQKLQLFSNSRRIRLDLLQSELPIKLSHCKLQLLW